MNTYLHWNEKYRPNKISDIICHNQNIKTIKCLLDNNSLPHLLFYGPPGTGKTSTIMSIANYIYGDKVKLMVMKLDASDDRGINSVREEIKGFAEKSNIFVKGLQLIILDEADSMTFDAQFALRRIIEIYSSTIRFCLICNYENKIIPAIRARCANFRYNNIDDISISIMLKKIMNKENLSYSENVINGITNIAKGDLRQAINILQIVYTYNKDITYEECYDILGLPTSHIIDNILSILCNNNINFEKAYYSINDIINNKYSLIDIINEILLKIINNIEIHYNICNIIIKLSELEIMLLKSKYIDIYVANLISIFKLKN